MLVPSCGVGVLVRVWCSGECLVGDNVGLGRSVSNNVAACLELTVQIFLISLSPSVRLTHVL